MSQVKFLSTFFLRHENIEVSNKKGCWELRQADDWLNHSSFRNRKGFVLKWKHLKRNTELSTQIPSPENLQVFSSRTKPFLTYFRYCGLCIPRVCSRTPFETSPLCQVSTYLTILIFHLISLNISILFRYSGRGPWKIFTVFTMFRPAPYHFLKLLYDFRTHAWITTFFCISKHIESFASICISFPFIS